MKINIGEKSGTKEVTNSILLNIICLTLTLVTIFFIHKMNALFYLLEVKGLIILVELLILPYVWHYIITFVFNIYNKKKFSD
jgi:hypothetical protein